MGSDFHVNYREETLISRLENSRQSAWGRQLSRLNECFEELSKRLAMKLVENHLIETNNIKAIEEQLSFALGELQQAEDFDIQYAVAPLRNLVERPNRIALYVTVYIIERLIKHRAVVDVFGTDEEIYQVVNQEVENMIR